LSHRPAPHHRLTDRQKERLEYAIADAAEQNQGLGCVDYVQCAKRICDNPEFAGEIDDIFGQGVAIHYRHIIMGSIIEKMIKDRVLTADEQGIYYISGSLVESSA
jgi:hypothetical protein